MRELLMFAVALSLPSAAVAQSPVRYAGGTYTQDFNSMGPTGTNTPPGWFVGVGDLATVTGPLNIGEGNPGVTSGVPGWNFGHTNATDRSLGTAATGPNRVIELRLLNDSGVPINAFEVHYDGEQWRSATGYGTGAGNDTIDRYRLQFSTNGTSYVDLGPGFNFTVPHLPPAVRYDGKQPTNRVAGIGGAYAPAAPIPNGATVYLKWFDFNLVGPTDGYMAIDNVSFRATDVAPPAVTQHPQSTNAVQCGTVSFTVAVVGSSPVIQWQRDSGAGFVDIPGETGLTLVVSNLAYPDDNGVQYRVHVSNNLGEADSTPATLTVFPDTTPPYVVRIIGETNLTTFLITFSEPMDPGTVVDPSGYKIQSQDGFEVLPISTVTRTSPTSVTIVTGSPRNPNKGYVLLMNEGGFLAIREACNPENQIAANTVVPVTLSIPVVGLTGQPWRYLDNSADLGPASNWASPTFDDSAWPVGNGLFDWKDTGVRAMVSGVPVGTTLRGLNPDGRRTTNVYFRTAVTLPGPATGAWLALNVIVDGGYVLYVNGVEAHRLRVPEGQNAATYATGGPPDANDDEDGDVEGPFIVDGSNLFDGINIIAVELHQDGDGSSDLDFVLQMNALVTDLFSGPVTLVQDPQSATINEGQTAGFNVAAQGGPPITYQWQKYTGGVFSDIPGQTGASLLLPNATPADDGEYRVVASNPFGSVPSAVATLVVDPDLTAPTLISAVGSTNLAEINLRFSRTISADTGADTANYSLVPLAGGGPLAILGATVDGAKVTLATAPRVFGASYRLTVGNLRDATFTGNLLSPNPTTVGALPQDVVVFTWNQTWRYETNCQSGSSWQMTDFSDVAWPSGPGVFGFEPSGSGATLLASLGLQNLTPLPVNTNIIAYYFRTMFQWPYGTSGVQFRLSHLVDDGAIFYLNGKPVAAFNETNPPPLSCSSISTGGGEVTLQETNLAGVMPGANTLAVEVHQQAATSSDVVFGAELIARLTSLGNLPRLSIVNEGSSVRITWTPASGTLQFKNNLDDAFWTDVPGQTVGNTLLPRDQLGRFYTVRP